MNPPNSPFNFRARRAFLKRAGLGCGSLALTSLLGDEGLVTQEDLDKSDMEHRVAQQELAEAVWRLKKTEIRAPFDGRITARDITLGQHIRLGEQAGIEKRFHPHGPLHTHAAQLRAEGVDIGIISKQLGHRSIATTARYLDHIAPWAVVEAMRGREW